MKFVASLSEFSHFVKNNETQLFEQIDNCKKFTLPDIEPTVQEISGYSGLVGTIELTDWMQVGAMELVFTYGTYPDKSGLLMTAEKQEHKIYWIEKYTDANGEQGDDLFCVYFTGTLKKIPGGDGEKGATADREFAYAVKTYKLLKNNEVLFEYDPMNNVVMFGGKNYADEVHRAVLGETM